MRPLLLALVACTSLGACSSGNRTDAAESNTLRIDYGGGEYLLGPASDDNPKFLVFLPMARWDNPCKTGEHTGLAERWEYTPDRLHWTFYLRRDLRWHDGVPVTARDIEFTINLWKHPDVLWYGAGPVESIEVIDDYTMRIDYSQPGTLENLDWGVYYPKHLLEDLDPKEFFEWEFWTRPVGNGPYRYVRHDRETHIEFESNPDYYEGKPPIERLMIALADVPGMVRLLAGEVDLAVVYPYDATRFAGNPDFNVYYGGWGTPIRLIWNVRHELFRDKEIRQALTMAIDRRELARVLGHPDEKLISDGVYSSCQFQQRDLPPAWPHDPERARSVLEAEGWHDADGDGILDRDGKAFQFNTIVDPRWQRAAVFAQDQLRRIGVRMEVQVMDAGVVVEQFGAGNFEAAIPRGPNLDAAIGRRGSPTGYSNVRVQELWDQVQGEIDREARDRMYGELSEFYYDELPGTFLHPRLSAMVARRRVRGLGSSPIEFPLVDRLWIEGER